MRVFFKQNKLKILIAFLLTVCIGQTNAQTSFNDCISLNTSVYRQRENVFNFKKEDRTNFKYEFGADFSIGYNKYLNKNMIIRAYAGYGFFKRKNIQEDNVPFQYKNRIVPVMAKLNYSFYFKNYGFGLIGGGGLSQLIERKQNLVSGLKESTSNTSFSYSYGIIWHLTTRNKIPFVSLHFEVLQIGDLKFHNMTYFYPIYRLKK